MLEFGSRGNSTLKEMNRLDVLRMKQKAAESQSSTPVCDVQPVHARDIRRMENALSSSNEPSIVVRMQAMFFNQLRAIVLRDVCLMYVPDGADSLLSMLKHYFMLNAGDAGPPSIGGTAK
ncbi:hypothetical protein PC117_g5386 [Phytophthora cactorum]|uniref:Uncharacterized protein n=1 Tax=Phytophthora cactorum TaxID=29920 RepID=A0A8T1ED55_9STRA|nr:hypothetical protein PC117_g5386 [Phytophthora cactorum]KAG3097012.1 hypothetical protein PC122_g4697 [Phytophthora cactorum]